MKIQEKNSKIRTGRSECAIIQKKCTYTPAEQILNYPFILNSMGIAISEAGKTKKKKIKSHHGVRMTLFPRVMRKKNGESQITLNTRAHELGTRARRPRGIRLARRRGVGGVGGGVEETGSGLLRPRQDSAGTFTRASRFSRFLASTRAHRRPFVYDRRRIILPTNITGGTVNPLVSNRGGARRAVCVYARFYPPARTARSSAACTGND